MSFSLSTGNTVYASASASITSNGDTSATVKVTASAYITNGWVQSTGVVVFITINGSTSSAKTVFGNGTRYNASDGTKSVTHSVSVPKGTSAKNVSWSVEFWQYTDGVKQTKKQTTSDTISITAKTSYKVQYNANGGTGAPATQTKWYGETLPLSSTKPTRSGYSFSKWNTASGGTGTSYNSGASYTANAAATLYAQWTPNTYTVTYNANGGSGAPGNQTKIHDQTLKLSTTTPSRMNYNFLGWATSASATTATYAAGGNYTANSAVTLYAVWEQAYTPPTIWDMKVDRCLQNGTLDPEGTYYKLSFSWACDDTIDGNEVEGITVEIKETTSTAYINPVQISASGTEGSVADKVLGGSCAAEKSYDIQITVVDKIDDASNKITLPTAKFIIDILAGGKGVAFGKAADTADLVDSAWRYRTTASGQTSTFGSRNADWCHYETTAPKHWFNKPIGVQGHVYAGDSYNRQLAYVDSTPQLREKTAIASNADLNSITTPGTYGCVDATAKTLKNCPVTTGFSMVVSHSYGSNISTNTYIDQEIHVAYYETIYRRRYNASSSSWSAWRNSRSYVGTGDSTVLWSGAAYMSGDQSASLSEAISEQPNGIVLVWSYYSGGFYNSNFSHHFVPKHFVQAHPNGGMWCTAIGTDYNMTKYVYINDTKIVGHADNTLSKLVNDIYVHNGNYCLRYVIGV